MFERRRLPLPSGRILDLARPRSEGVLDEEEYEHCLRNGITLAYDCLQSGWLPACCEDDLSKTVATAPAGPTSPLPHPEPELRILELRSGLGKELQRVVADVQQRRISVAEAELAISGRVAEKAIAFAGDGQDFSSVDRCYSALAVAAAEALAAFRRPGFARQLENESSVSFRHWTIGDVGVYASLLGDPEVWKYLPEPYPSPFTEDTARQLIEVASIGFHHEVVAVLVNGVPVGQCTFRFAPPFCGLNITEVAYWLGLEHQGRGLMSRILPVFTSRSFELHPVDVIYAWIRADNQASIRVAERSGYRRCQRSPETA